MTTLYELLRQQVVGWERLRIGDLLFHHRNAAMLTVTVMIAASATLLFGRSLLWREHRGAQVALPAILRSIPRSPLSVVRHIPLLLFVAGLGFFSIALTDPYIRFTEGKVSFPGRRIALLIDASSSMVSRFGPSVFAPESTSPSTFLTTVSAAEQFVRGRIRGGYRDLIGLIEF